MMKKSVKLGLSLFIVIACCLLQGCVTEKTGGFPQPAREEAFKDYIKLALSYTDLGEYDRAMKNLKNARKLIPDSAQIQYVMARMYVRKEEYGLADTEYRRALEIDPADSVIRHNYSIFLYGRKRISDACKQFAILVEDVLYSERSQAFEHLGTCQLRSNQKNAALNSFLRAISLSENRRSKSLLELSQLYYEKREYNEADKYLRRYRTNLLLLKRNPSPRSLWLGIRVSRALGDSKTSAREGEVLGRLYPNSQEFQQYLNLIDNDDE